MLAQIFDREVHEPADRRHARVAAAAAPCDPNARHRDPAASVDAIASSAPALQQCVFLCLQLRLDGLQRFGVMGPLRHVALLRLHLFHPLLLLRMLVHPLLRFGVLGPLRHHALPPPPLPSAAAASRARPPFLRVVLAVHHTPRTVRSRTFP